MADAKYIGDHVEAALKKVRADKIAEKVAEFVEKVTNVKRPCGCQKRKEQLNEMHKKLLGQTIPKEEKK